jgi:6-phosphofructokinase 1
VTCGGLCPGINSVIKSIVECLSFEYGAQNIWGVKYGYTGFLQDDQFFVKLTPYEVKGIQNLGGTILGTNRGGFDANIIVDALVRRGIN